MLCGQWDRSRLGSRAGSRCVGRVTAMVVMMVMTIVVVVVVVTTMVIIGRAAAGIIAAVRVQVDHTRTTISFLDLGIIIGINILQVDPGNLFALLLSGVVLAKIFLSTGGSVLVKTTLVESGATTVTINSGAVADLIEGGGSGETEGVGPLDDLAGLALIAGHGALVHWLASSQLTRAGSGLLSTATTLPAPSRAAAGSIRARSGAVSGLGARRDGLTATLGASVAALGALVASAAQTEGTRRTVRMAAAAIIVIITAGALWLVLAPVAVNFTVVYSSGTAANKEIVTVDAGSVRVDSGLADGILAEETVSLH